MAGGSVFGRVLLITSSGAGAEFLAERMQARAVAAVRSADPDCEITVSSAGSLVPNELLGLTSASLFSAASAVVLTDLQDISDGPAAELLAYVDEPAPDVALVLVHGGGQKGKKLLEGLRAAASVSEAKLEAPKYEREFVTWVRGEAKELSASIDEAAATLLVQAVGQDLRALAGAVDQLSATREGDRPIGLEVVRQYFGGRADVRGYEIADAAIDGRYDIALERVRWAETAKIPATYITTALASGLRSLAKLSDADNRPTRLSEADVAKFVGAPPFKIRSLRQQLRGWSTEGLAQALRLVASTDIDIKSGETDSAYAVERLVLQIAQARRG